MDPTAAAKSAFSRLYAQMDEDTRRQKGAELKIIASAYLAEILPLQTKMTIIDTKLRRKAAFSRTIKKLKQLFSDTAIDKEFELLNAQIDNKLIQVTEAEQKACLEQIQLLTDRFQNNIFRIWGIQDLVYLTVEASGNKDGVARTRAYTIKPGVSIQRKAKGGFSARVTIDNISDENKDASLNSLIRGMAAGAGNNDLGSIMKNYSQLSTTYNEVLFRYDVSRAKDGDYKGKPMVWWFSDGSHSDVAGMLYVGQAGDLAETFVSYLPIIVTDGEASAPYSGVMDPDDVKTFLEGTSKVTNAKGRLLGDVTAIIESDGEKKILQIAVKAKGASHMGYMQMIELARAILMCPDDAQVLTKLYAIQLQDERAGQGRKQQLQEGTKKVQEATSAVVKDFEKAFIEREAKRLKNLTK